MRNWLVIRHGSNAANQTLQDRAVLGIVEAHTKDDAHETAEAKYTLYANQTIEVVEELDALSEEWNQAVDIQADR